MKEIVVISGKGGTGKTSITASFAYLGGEDVIVADPAEITGETVVVDGTAETPVE